MEQKHFGCRPFVNIPQYHALDITYIFNFQYFRSLKRGSALQWRHNNHDGVSNHQPHGCLLNRLFRRRSKKTSKLRVTGLCAGNSPGTGEFTAQMASYAESVSIWWRHHGMCVIFSESHNSHGHFWNLIMQLFSKPLQVIPNCKWESMSEYFKSLSVENGKYRFDLFVISNWWDFLLLFSKNDYSNQGTH